MKALLALVILGALGYFAYGKYEQSAAPEEIVEPVFAEMRVDVKVQGRELEFVLYGKMADDEDCRTRAGIVWDKAIAGCKECDLAVTSCQKEIAPRTRSSSTINPSVPLI